MPDYLFSASIALATAAAISATVNLSASKQKGKIKLEGPEGERQYDPFDVTTPEDVAPGEPIDGPQFWSRVRSWIPLFILLAYMSRVFKYYFRNDRFVSSSLSFSLTSPPFSFFKRSRSGGHSQPSNPRMLLSLP